MSSDARAGDVDAGWTALLAHATALVRAASALTPDHDGPRWRGSLASIIGLQAIAMALGWAVERAESDPRGLAVAVDRAGLELRGHGAALREVWGDAAPSSIAAIWEDACAAYAAALARAGGMA